MSTKDLVIDINSFDSVKQAESGYELMLKNTDGTDSGVILEVIGAHSNEVMAFTKSKLNKYIRDEAMAKKRGKEVEMDADKILDQAREDAMVRVRGWKNVKQEFSKDLLKAVLMRNPHWLSQITEASDDAANFTKSS
jgi:hypothetical protein